MTERIEDARPDGKSAEKMLILIFKQLNNIQFKKYIKIKNITFVTLSESVMDLDLWSNIIIFTSSLTIFKLSIVF